VAVAIAAQTRVTWSFVAVPLLWVALRPQDRWQWGLFVGYSLAFVTALYVEAIFVISPYPNFMKKVLDGSADSPLATSWLILRHTLKNAVRYVAPNHDHLLQIGFRYQVLMVAGAAIYHLRQTYLRRKLRDGADSVEQSELGLAAFGFAFLNLFCIVGFVIVLYDVFGTADYRIVAPHMLLGLLLLVACGARDWLKGYAVVAVLLLPLVLIQFPKYHRDRVAFDPSQVAAFAGQVHQVMAFEPGASPWDNTLLMDMHYMDAQELLMLPRGIGISTVLRWEYQAWPPRSKYVLLTRERAQRVGIPPTMQKVAETRIGDIYMRR
jgi:hypothetical protein